MRSRTRCVRCLFCTFAVNKFEAIKFLSKIIRIVIAAVVGLYVLIVLLCNMPFSRHYLSNEISERLSTVLGTKVSVSDTRLNILGSVGFSDIYISDQSGKDLLKADELRARFNLGDVMTGKIVISNLVLHKAYCNFYQANDRAKPNYQFLIDSLSSGKKPKEKGMDFLVRTFIIRNLNLKYNRLDQPSPALRQMDLNHVDIRDLNANIRINKIAGDSLNFRVRDIGFQERSGMKVDHLALNFIAGKRTMQIRDFILKTPGSSLEIDDCVATNSRPAGDKPDFLHSHFKGLRLKARVLLPEFSPLYLPLKRFGNAPLNLTATISKDDDGIRIFSSLSHRTPETLYLQSHTDLDFPMLMKKKLSMKCRILKLRVDPAEMATIVSVASPDTKWPAVMEKAGTLDCQALVAVNPQKTDFTGSVSCDLGSVKGHVGMRQSHILADIETDQLDLGTLLDKSDMIGKVNAKVQLAGTTGKQMNLNVNSTIDPIEVKGYSYKNISLAGTYSASGTHVDLKVLDENLTASVVAGYKEQGKDLLHASVTVDRLNAGALHLTDKYPGNVISGQLYANIRELTSTPTGTVRILHFKMREKDRGYGFDSLCVSSTRTVDRIRTTVASDMFDARILGNVEVKDIPAYFYSFFKKQVDILPQYKFNVRNDKSASFDLCLKKTDLLEHLVDIPIRPNGPLHCNGYFDTSSREVKMTALLPSFKLNDDGYKDGSVYLTARGDTLSLLGQVTKQFQNGEVRLALNTDAYNNTVMAQAKWKVLEDRGSRGSLKTETSFYKDESGTDHARIKVFPSTFFINDSAWAVNPSSIDLKKGAYSIHNFKISHDDQFISLSNTPDSISDGKGLIAKLNDINLGYIFDILDFHPVEFDGKLSGTVVANNPATDKDVNARLHVKDFLFNTGDMGNMSLVGRWDHTNKQISIHAKTQQTKEDSTLINGYVDVDKSRIDLNFNSVSTNMEFLNEYLSGFIGDLAGRCSGRLKLYGPLDAMNLEGRECIDRLSFKPKPLNVTYHITNDSIIFSPGKFLFKNMTLNDEKGNSAQVNGQVTHRVLHDFGYDFNFDADNLLAYDWNGQETDGFWGTVFADGKCRLRGTPDDVYLDVDITPKKETVFVYDSSDPDAGENKEYIHFTKTGAAADTTAHGGTEDEEKEDHIDSSTNTYFNFKINANPDATFVILTDSKTGDNMSLNGSGPIHINYYNKGKFSIFGTYKIDHGLYKITIKDIIHKNFQMQSGGTIRFNGAPLEGALDMKGIYTINSVSLADLNLGNLRNNSSANVDCILNFKGNCAAPEVSFDLDFSNVNDDEKQMVKNMIASQGDMNMQVIYLLSIGRFFTYDYSNFNSGSNQNQSSVAMKSLVASTLSEQFNTMLSNAFHINNWKFGTNISTGRIGWSDMEVEGLLSGSLLNNRLLIDGNFGYRDQSYYTNNFVGDFNLRWLLTRSGIISLKAYSETNDRYFTKTALTTNGAGILFQKDFNLLKELFKRP